MVPENSNRSIGVNSTAQTSTIATFQCPSDLDRLTNIQGHHNYAGNVGSDGNSFYSATTYNGPFSDRGKAIGLRDVIDGTSNTAAFSERVKGVGGDNPTKFDLTTPSATFSVALTNTGVPQTDYNACKAAPLSLGKYAPGDASGMYWTPGDGADLLYNHVMTPNSWSCASGYTWDPGAASTASSRHPGVVNVVFSDGSVRAVKSTVANTVWWAIGTMAGAEVISSDAY